jgi:hypothetical protein
MSEGNSMYTGRFCRRQDDAIDLSNGILGSETRLSNRHFRENTIEVAFFTIGESVMHQVSTLNGSQWKGATNQDHGNSSA